MYVVLKYVSCLILSFIFLFGSGVPVHNESPSPASAHFRCHNSKFTTRDNALLAEAWTFRHHHLSCHMTKPTNRRLRSAWASSLFRVFTVRMKNHWVLSYPLSALRRLWSDWVDAQAVLSLHWIHRSFCWFYHEAAPIILYQYRCVRSW